MSLKIIKCSNQINRVLKQGNRIHSDSFSIFYLKNQDNSCGFAPIAGKKIFKSAVSRNFIKRRIRALIRESNLNINGLKIIIMAKESLNNVLFAELKSEFQIKLSKIN